MVKRLLKRVLRKVIRFAYPLIGELECNSDINTIQNICDNCSLGKYTKLYGPYHIYNTRIGDYSYVARNSWISIAEIGKFCSVGPNVIIGWGIHPINGISTSPMFYSTMKQNGLSLSNKDKIEERKPIVIGNDVFIGANVTILDGVTIGDGAVIGAGAVVSKDIPPYSIAVGCPIQILRYRHNEPQREALQRIKWWNLDDEGLKKVEQYFFDIDGFLEEFDQGHCC